MLRFHLPGLRTRLSVLLTAAALLASCAPAAPTPFSPRSSTPIQVYEAAKGLNNPTVAADASHHRVYVAWTEYPNDVNAISYLAVSNDDGKTFAKPVELPDKYADHPVLRVITDGALFAGWTHWDMDHLMISGDLGSNPAQQYLVRSTDGGQTFSAPGIASQGPQTTGYFMALAVSPDGRTATFAWFDYTDFALHKDGPARDAVAMYTATSFDGGATFGAAVKASDLVCVCCMPVGLVQNGHPAFLLRGFTPGGDAGDLRDTTLVRSPDQGQTWNAPVTVYADNFHVPGCPHLGPGAVVDAHGRLHVTWWTGAPGRAGYWYSESADGTKFSEPVKLADQLEDMHGNNLTLAVDGQGTVWATAVTLPKAAPTPDLNGNDPGGDFHVWAIPAGGSPVAVDSASGSGMYPAVAPLEHGAVLLWLDGNKLMLRRVETGS